MQTSLSQPATFADRTAAGKALAARLVTAGCEKPVVLALPRGGVPVAVEIARALEAPLDLLMVRKLGVPGHEEVALGAVMDGKRPTYFINEDIRRISNIGEEEFERLVERELAEIERRRTVYLGDREPADIEGATAIVVDDGIATGATMRVALDAARRYHPARLVIATGVAPPDVVGQLRTEVDDIACLAEPDPLRAIGLYYDDFRQVSDNEVIEMLAALPDRR